jgi:hypothetical protein
VKIDQFTMRCRVRTSMNALSDERAMEDEGRGRRGDRWGVTR